MKFEDLRNWQLDVTILPPSDAGMNNATKRFKNNCGASVLETTSNLKYEMVLKKKHYAIYIKHFLHPYFYPPAKKLSSRLIPYIGLFSTTFFAV